MLSTNLIGLKHQLVPVFLLCAHPVLVHVRVFGQRAVRLRLGAQHVRMAHDKQAFANAQ